MLSKKTANGTASSIVDKHMDSFDGVLEWKDLKKHYEFGGYKTVRATTLVTELSNIRLDYNTFGGFDTYYNKFDTKCLELEK